MLVALEFCFSGGKGGWFSFTYGGVGIGSGDKYFTVLGQRPSASVSLELLVEIDSLLLLY